MKKIVPFKKDLNFKTNLSEITSISLEHSLKLSNNNLVTGNFIITGDYKMTDNSTNTESFSFELPFDINIDEKYDTKNLNIDIDDFYYEIIDNKILSVNIDVLLDKLEEVPLIVNNETTVERCYDEEEFPFKEIENVVPTELTNETEEDTKRNNIEKDENVKSIFSNFDDSTDTFSTYRVYIFRETDTIEGIMKKYSISNENLSLYNNLSDIKIGDKIIIPSFKNEKV